MGYEEKKRAMAAKLAALGLPGLGFQSKVEVTLGSETYPGLIRGVDPTGEKVLVQLNGEAGNIAVRPDQIEPFGTVAEVGS